MIKLKLNLRTFSFFMQTSSNPLEPVAMKDTKSLDKMDLGQSVRSQVDAYVKEARALKKEAKTISKELADKGVSGMSPKAAKRVVYALAGDISQVIRKSHCVQEENDKAQELVERVIQEEIIDRVDLPDEAKSILQYVLMDALPRMIGGAAKRWFSKLDRDGDGVVTKEEFAQGVANQCCCGSKCMESFCGLWFPCARACCGGDAKKSK